MAQVIWDSSVQTPSELNIYRTAINNCLKNKSKSSAGYIWKFINF